MRRIHEKLKIEDCCSHAVVLKYKEPDTILLEPEDRWYLQFIEEIRCARCDRKLKAEEIEDEACKD